MTLSAMPFYTHQIAADFPMLIARRRSTQRYSVEALEIEKLMAVARESQTQLDEGQLNGNPSSSAASSAISSENEAIDTRIVEPATTITQTFEVQQFTRGQDVIKLEAEDEAKPYLRNAFKCIADSVVPICQNRAIQMGLPIRSYMVSVRRSWEGDFLEVVLQVFASGNFAQCLSLWDSIGVAIQKWQMTLDAKLKRLVVEQMSIHVEPVDPNAF